MQLSKLTRLQAWDEVEQLYKLPTGGGQPPIVILCHKENSFVQEARTRVNMSGKSPYVLHHLWLCRLEADRRPLTQENLAHYQAELKFFPALFCFTDIKAGGMTACLTSENVPTGGAKQPSA